MGNNSFIGREYASYLIKEKINFDIIILGKNLRIKLKRKEQWVFGDLSLR